MLTAPVGTDDFASAPAIPLGSITPTMDLSTFTVSPDEPYAPDWTAWWTFTPTVNGPVVFDTFLSPDTTGTDTVIDVYSGTAETNLVSVGHSDNVSYRSDYLSLVLVELTAGQTYYVRLGCWDYGAPTAAVLRVRPGQWQAWVDRPASSGSLDFTPGAATDVLPDGSNISLHMINSIREADDISGSGVDHTQDAWDRVRGVRDPGSAINLLLNWTDPDPSLSWDLMGQIDGEYQGDGLFHPAASKVLEKLLHPLFYVNANSEVLLGDGEVAYENEAEPVWHVDISATVTGPQAPDSVDPSFEEARAESWRLHAQTDKPWEQSYAATSWPFDHLGADGSTLHFDVTGWFTHQQVSVFPETLYSAGFPTPTRQRTWLYARNMTFHATVTVDMPRYRVARAFDTTEPPPPVVGPITITANLSGNLKDVDRQFT